LSLGYFVRTASDGFTALQEIRKQIPDVLLSDLTMSGMSGFELLSVVRRLFPAIHVVAMSGLFAGNQSQPGIAADGFHEKATSVPNLLELVEASQREDRSSILERRNLTDPVWIPRNGHDPAGLEFVTITCPDCLRTFSEVLKNDQRQIRHAKCIHCSQFVRYAIVPSPGTALSMQF
jgi:CheY-like chemotaxis protein